MSASDFSRMCFGTTKIDFNRPFEVKRDIGEILSKLPGVKMAKIPKKPAVQVKEPRLKTTVKEASTHPKADVTFVSPGPGSHRMPTSKRSKFSSKKSDALKLTEVGSLPPPPIVVLSHLEARLFMLKEGARRKLEAKLELSRSKPQRKPKKKPKQKKKSALVLTPPTFIIEHKRFHIEDIGQRDFLGSLELIKKN